MPIYSVWRKKRRVRGPYLYKRAAAPVDCSLPGASGLRNYIRATLWNSQLGCRASASSAMQRHFRENEIDEKVLPNLTTQDLKDLGVNRVGHRRKLLDAIALLRSERAEAGSLPILPDKNAAPADSAERRQVTVMFVDLATELSARVDPEDFRETITAYQKSVSETVTRLGGFVAKYMGDRVLAYFGYPKAHEDDAERAVRAGLELVDQVAALKLQVSLQAASA